MQSSQAVFKTDSVSKPPTGVCCYVCHRSFTPQWWQPDLILISVNAVVKTEVYVIAYGQQPACGGMCEGSHIQPYIFEPNNRWWTREPGMSEMAVKLGLHLNANANDVCGQETRQNII